MREFSGEKMDCRRGGPHLEQGDGRSEKELRLRNQIVSIFLIKSDDSIYRDVLGVILDALESEFGVFGYLNLDNALVCPSLTEGIWERCRMHDKEPFFPLEKIPRVAELLRGGKGSCFNQPVDVPEGHCPVERVLSMPIVHQGRPIGIIRVANKKTDYDNGDLEFLEAISNHIAPILAARLELSGKDAARRLAEKRLQDSLDEWERMFNATGDIITIQDSEMRIVRLNRAACLALDRDEQELIGKKCFEVFRGTEEPCEGCPELKTIRDYQIHSAEIHHPNLNKTFLVSASPIINGNGEFTGIIHIAKDITSQKKLEEQLIQALKMEAIGRLSGGIAHDFNNLLTTIMGYSDLAMMKLSNEDPLHGYVKAINDAAKRASALTRQLLAFSRKQILEMKVVNINDVINSMGKMLGRMIGEDIALEMHVQYSIGNIMADPSQLEQIIMNLAVNARDAMPRGGKLIIETGQINVDDEYAARYEGLGPGPHAVITFADTGEGMSREIQEKIFEPFFTTKAEGVGTGLGLAMVYGIVKQHRGHITVYSEKGTGTIFKMLFPMVDKEAENLFDERKPGLPLGSETVLVVDDESDIIQFIKDTLDPLGYRILIAGSGKEALEMCKEMEAEIDLLLTDVIMPGMNGRELARLLISLMPKMKVIYMSGYTDNIITHRGMLEPGLHFINKPLGPTQLATMLRSVLDV